MPKDQPYRNHLKNSGSLVTTYEEVRAGFVALALERSRRATPFVEEARTLKAIAGRATIPHQLLKIKEIQPALLTASGVSDKAGNHMLETDKTEAINGLIAKYLEPAGPAFVEELVFRFLLTRGDALGGSMRNVGGALAQRKLTRALISALTLRKIKYFWLNSSSNTWISASDDDTDIELFLRGISWGPPEGERRTALFNLKVPLVRNNIDLCLLNCDYKEAEIKYTESKLYIALGELKGGIDPAGADEHWKTAKTALGRIKKAFKAKKLTPHTFFVGAAIEKKMAEEIWEELRTGVLSNAANLTDSTQLASLCNWLSHL